MKIDDEEFKMRNGLGARGWQWMTLDRHAMRAGQHTLTLGYREDGFKIDKICLSTFFMAPTGLGPAAEAIDKR